MSPFASFISLCASLSIVPARLIELLLSVSPLNWKTSALLPSRSPIAQVLIFFPFFCTFFALIWFVYSIFWWRAKSRCAVTRIINPLSFLRVLEVLVVACHFARFHSSQPYLSCTLFNLSGKKDIFDHVTWNLFSVQRIGAFYHWLFSLFWSLMIFQTETRAIFIAL